MTKLLALILLCFSCQSSEIITWKVEGRAPKHFRDEINIAVGQWMQATEGEYEFVEVDRREKAVHLRFIWDKNLVYAESGIVGYYGEAGFYRWTFIAVNPYRVKDRRILRTVLLHEIGHHLHVAHTDDPDGVMFPVTDLPKLYLRASDILAWRNRK